VAWTHQAPRADQPARQTQLNAPQAGIGPGGERVNPNRSMTMNAKLWTAVLVIGGVLAAAYAEDAPAREGKRPGRPGGEEMRAKILEKFDANKDGKLDETERAEARKAMAERARAGAQDRRENILEKFDENKDGKLDEAERAKAKAAFLAKIDEPGPLHEMMLRRFDEDKDGKLSDAEKAKAVAEFEKRHEEMRARREEVLKEFDKDGDGKLNEEERKAAGEAMRKKLIEKFDKDGDGKLSEEERKAAREAMPPRPGPLGPGGPRPGLRGARPGGGRAGR